MIVMDLKVDNFFAFENFHINMSYPKKIVNSFIENEFLAERKNFRYRKVNIIMGGNAVGKTTLGRMLMMVFNFIEKKNSELLFEKICDKSQYAHFSIDFVVKSHKLYRVEVMVSPQIGDNNNESNINVITKSVEIKPNDSYESCAKRLSEIQTEPNDNYINELKKIESLTWIFKYPNSTKENIENYDEKYLRILDYTLRALDPSIQKVEKINVVEDSYIIRMKGQDLIIQDGTLVKDNILSSGTQSGIVIAEMIAAIKLGDYGFHYSDELFSYIHSDLEKAFLCIMINSLKDNHQLFFTTHNTDILDLPLPKHSFVFLKKDINDLVQPMKSVNAADYLKRNTDSLRNAVENDLFSTAPSIDLVNDLLNI